MLTSAKQGRPARARVGKLAGDWNLGRDFGAHLRKEDDETNPLVPSKAADDDGKRPATRRTMAAARVARGRRAPVTGDGKGSVAELLLAPVHLTVVAATDGDDGGGGAA